MGFRNREETDGKERRKDIRGYHIQRISMPIQRGKAACISSAMLLDGVNLQTIFYL